MLSKYQPNWLRTAAQLCSANLIRPTVDYFYIIIIMVIMLIGWNAQQYLISMEFSSRHSVGW